MTYLGRGVEDIKQHKKTGDWTSERKERKKTARSVNLFLICAVWILV